MEGQCQQPVFHSVHRVNHLSDTHAAVQVQGDGHCAASQPTGPRFADVDAVDARDERQLVLEPANGMR